MSAKKLHPLVLLIGYSINARLRGPYKTLNCDIPLQRYLSDLFFSSVSLNEETEKVTWNCLILS